MGRSSLDEKKNTRIRTGKSVRILLFGGGEGNRTPVRRFSFTVFSERSQDIVIPSAARPLTGLQLW